VQLFNRPSKVRTPPPGVKTSSGIQFLLSHAREGMHRTGAGLVIAFTSANPGAGVSYVVRKLGAQLANHTNEPTALVEGERLAKLRSVDLINLRTKCARTNIDQLWTLRASSNGHGHHSNGDSAAYLPEVASGLDCVKTLRSTFTYTLLDCPSLSDSSEAPFLAPHLDGVVLVVEADRTRRDQILRAQQTIELAGGKLLAMVLNKRRHMVPEWLYRRL
jgi:Mrp family chromosome partitioning ATPase